MSLSKFNWLSKFTPHIYTNNFFYNLLLCYSQSDSNSRLSEEEHKTDSASEEAVDDVDLEV